VDRGAHPAASGDRAAMLAGAVAAALAFAVALRSASSGDAPRSPRWHVATRASYR
jgi:hypothetical protein